MLDILASSHYYTAIDPAQPLPDLRPAVSDTCRERPRRIDRFTQLALLGSARCLQGRSAAADTGLYIGSRYASLGNTNQVHRQLIRHGDTPKPAHFINTLSNAAGYHVARNLGLSGRNLFVSRSDASLVAILQLAALDLATAAVPAALIGVVEEGMEPAAEHCRRLQLPTDTPLGEGSHWLLLSAAGQSDSGERLGQLDQIQTLADTTALQDWLQGMSEAAAGEPPWLFATPLTRAEYGHCLAALPTFDAGLNYYPALAAGALLEFLQAPANGATCLLCVIADDDGRFHVLRAQRQSNAACS